MFSLHLCNKTEGDEKVGRRSSEKDESRGGEKKGNGKKGSKKLFADILGPEDMKIKLRRNTDVLPESGTSVSVSQVWRI